MANSDLSSSRRSLVEHIQQVLDNTAVASPVLVPLTEASGLTLAQDVRANLPVPPFSNSAMDGYLVHSTDLVDDGPWTFPVIGDVPAGALAQKVPKHHAVRIMTGAPVGDPYNSDLVVIPVEQTDTEFGATPLPQTVVVNEIIADKPHIRNRGENLHVGDIVANAGEVIDAGLLAGLISTGVTEVSAYPRPKVTVLSSGNELAEPGTALQPGQIPNSNQPMIVELLKSQGITSIKGVHCRDGKTDFTEKFLAAVEDSDLVILSPLEGYQWVPSILSGK